MQCLYFISNQLMAFLESTVLRFQQMFCTRLSYGCSLIKDSGTHLQSDKCRCAESASVKENTQFLGEGVFLGLVKGSGLWQGDWKEELEKHRSGLFWMSTRCEQFGTLETNASSGSRENRMRLGRCATDRKVTIFQRKHFHSSSALILFGCKHYLSQFDWQRAWFSLI